MANIGRVYPRLFRRDWGWYSPANIYVYPPRQIIFGLWPLNVGIPSTFTEPISEPATYTSDGLGISYYFPYKPGGDPTDFTRVEFRVSDNDYTWSAYVEFSLYQWGHSYTYQTSYGGGYDWRLGVDQYHWLSIPGDNPVSGPEGIAIQASWAILGV